MNTQNDINGDTKHLDEAELLLPWYAAGTLDPEENAKVETWLKDNPDGAAHLERAREELHVTATASESLGLPKSDAFEQLAQSLNLSEKSPPASSGFLERIWEMLTPRFAMAGAAALALLVIAQAATIGVLVTDQPAGFETASGQTAQHTGPSALVSFNTALTHGDISAYLAEHRLTIIDGPKPGGIYRISAPDDAEGAAALDALGADTGLIAFFAPAN